MTKPYTHRQKICLIIAGMIWLAGMGVQFTQTTLFGLSSVGLSALCIFVTSLILWIGVATDWPSLLCLVSLAMLEPLNMTQVLSFSFGNVIVAFLLWTFVAMYALNQTPALQRLTAWVLNHPLANKSSWRFLSLWLTFVWLLSSVLSPTVVFMFIFPIYEEICAQFGWQKGEKAPTLVIIALCMVISIGAAMTPINHVFALTAMGLYANVTGLTISYTSYMAVMVPTGTVLFAMVLAMLQWRLKPLLHHGSVQKIASLQDIPPMTIRERIITISFLMMLLMWIVPEWLGNILPSVAQFFKGAGLAFPPFVLVILLAVVQMDGKPLVDISTALTKGVHWQSVLLVSATLALGKVLAMPEMSIVEWLNTTLTPLMVQLPIGLFVLFIIVWTGLQTNFTSNLVTVTVVTTFALTIYEANPHLPLPMATICCLIGFMSTLAFATPPAMPYVAISVGSGWANSRQVLLYGLGGLFAAIIVNMLIAYPLGQLLLG